MTRWAASAVSSTLYSLLNTLSVLTTSRPVEPEALHEGEGGLSAHTIIFLMFTLTDKPSNRAIILLRASGKRVATMATPKLLNTLRNGQTAMTTFLALKGVRHAQVVAHTGLDAAIIDREHGVSATLTCMTWSAS